MTKRVVHFRAGLLVIAVLASVTACSSSDSDSEALASSDGALAAKVLCAGPKDQACPPGHFCAAVEVGKCPSFLQYGICVPRPDSCAEIAAPVCGCEGRTYDNACLAAAAGAAIASKAACPARGESCGGVANIACPAGQVCVDDPADDCEPRTGGSDCSGVCVEAPGASCGSMTCPAGGTCCNPLLSICAKAGAACPM
jgi:hypothetical protein